MLKIDIRKMAAANWEHMVDSVLFERHPVLFVLVMVPWFLLLMPYTLIASQWAWFITNRSDLAERIAAPDANIQGIKNVRRVAQKRVERGLLGYQAWVDYCDEILAWQRMAGRVERPAG